MGKYLVKENTSGEIILTNDNWEISTHPIHKQIWVENYLNVEVIEGVNFSTDEVHIDCGFFQIFAYPIITMK